MSGVKSLLRVVPNNNENYVRYNLKKALIHMAIAIKDTPVLMGEDAKRFLSEIKENENIRASKEELSRMKSNYEIFKKLEAQSK